MFKRWKLLMHSLFKNKNKILFVCMVVKKQAIELLIYVSCNDNRSIDFTQWNITQLELEWVCR